MGAPFAVEPLPPTALVVDDEPAICKLLATLLKTIGFESTLAASAEEALAIVETRPFACLITDKNLPGMDGIDLVRAMRVAQPHCACIVVTGYASHDSAIEALQLGASDYIEKPFHNSIVLERVKRAVATAQATYELAALHAQAIELLRSAGKTVPEGGHGLAAALNAAFGLNV